MWRLISAEFRYSGWLVLIVFSLTLSLLTAVFLVGGETKWREPSLLVHGLLFLAVMAFSVRANMEKRIQFLAKLPIDPKKFAIAFTLNFLLIVLAGHLLVSVVVLLIKPELLNADYLVMALLTSGALFATIGCLSVAGSFNTGQIFRSNWLRFIGVGVSAAVGLFCYILPNLAFFINLFTSFDYHGSKGSVYPWMSSFAFAGLVFIFGILMLFLYIFTFDKRKSLLK